MRGSEMRTLPAFLLGLMLGTIQRTPVVLSGDALDTVFDSVPPELVDRQAWLGLFAAGTGANQNSQGGRLQVARVRFVRRRDEGRPIYRIETTPAGAILLVSGVPGLTSGAAVTLARSVTLSEERRTVQFELSQRRYTIRLETKAAD